jgi:hypothetical protein
MKKLFFVFLFLLFSLNNLRSQNVSGIILDSITKQPLDLVNIIISNTNIGVYTNPNGKFKLQLTNPTDNLNISYIGYKTRGINSAHFINKKEYEAVFYLSPTTAQLNEVVIENKKINYGWSKTIASPRENTRFFGFQFGTENCTYVKNPDRKKAKIVTVILDLKKTAEYDKDNPKWKLDYLSDYNIKFYEIDLLNNSPGKEIYDKDIVVNPENKTRSFAINIDSLNIPFSENGICIGVEMINTRYQNPKKVFATIGPSINFTENREKNPIMAWSRYRNEKEWRFLPAPKTQDKKGWKYKMMIVDLVIKPEKE